MYSEILAWSEKEREPSQTTVRGATPSVGRREKMASGAFATNFPTHPERPKMLNPMAKIKKARRILPPS
jgi:hypothetical protein